MPPVEEVMDSPLPTQIDPLPTFASVRPLTQAKVDGTPYVRFADIELQIQETVVTDPQNWSPDALKSETLVHLIRWQIAHGDDRAIGPMFDCLGRRIAEIVGDFARGFDSGTATAIADEIAMDIVELVFAKAPSRKSEFLEVAFEQAVKRRTINKVESHKKRGVRVISETTLIPKDSTTSRPGIVESHPDAAPGPEQLALLAEAAQLQPELIRKAYAAIKDERHREAIILNFQGWQLDSTDPQIITLSTHFGVSGRQIRTWLKTAIEEMRTALGEQT